MLTDTCENITFPRTSYAGGNNWLNRKLGTNKERVIYMYLFHKF